MVLFTVQFGPCNMALQLGAF